MQDRPVQNSGTDFDNSPATPLASVIACGHVLGNSGRPDVRATCLPCYQALGPWGEPDAGLPWFRIGSTESLGGPDDRMPATAEPLAVILGRARQLVLVVGADHDSLALALAIATLARRRGIRVTALLAGRPGQTIFQRAALQSCADAVRECPASQDPLALAQAMGARPDGRRPDGAELPDPPPAAPPWPGQS